MFDNLKNMGNMVKQAKEMKQKMQEVQNELKRLEIKGYGYKNNVEMSVYF